MNKIDINADLGEGAGNDEAIMPLISSCNIACGGHVGDETSIRKTIRLAKKHRVKIGAHPAFPDRENFGRKLIDINKEELENSLKEQLLLFCQICEEEKVKINHIKAHGALYNHGSNREDDVEVMLKVFSEILPKSKLYLQSNSLLYQKATDRFPIYLEAFIDRTYANENSLVSRSHDKALITKPEKAWQQLYNIYRHNKIVDLEGNEYKVEAQTFCIHGDHKAAVEILEYIHKQLNANDIKLA